MKFIKLSILTLLIVPLLADGVNVNAQSQESIVSITFIEPEGDELDRLNEKREEIERERVKSISVLDVSAPNDNGIYTTFEYSDKSLTIRVDK